MHQRTLVVGLLVVGLLVVLGGGAAWLRAERRLENELAESRKEMAAGLFTTARARLTRLARERPGHAEVAFQLGRCEAARGKPAEAMSLWARVPADSPWAGPAALDFANSAIALGQIALAEQVLTLAMRRPSHELPALRHLLLILLGQQGRIVEARRFLEGLWRDTAVLPTGDLGDRLALVHEHIGLDFELFPLEWNLSQLEGGPVPADDDDRRALARSRAHLALLSGEFARAKMELESCSGPEVDDPLVWKCWLDWAVATGKVDLARQAVEHVPARLLDDAEMMDLRVWLARQRHDEPAERHALEDLLTLEPGRTMAVTRLAELVQRAGDAPAAAKVQYRKTELDASIDSYFRLYKEKRFADRLAELAALAERLGRRFEARAFWELVGARVPSDTASRSALARLGPVAPPRSDRPGSVAKSWAPSWRRHPRLVPGPARQPERRQVRSPDSMTWPRMPAWLSLFRTTVGRRSINSPRWRAAALV